MRQRAMQFSNARVARSGQMRKDVPFPLRNPETIQEDANAVRGAMNFRNQAKRLSRHRDRMKLSVLHLFPARASAFGRVNTTLSTFWPLVPAVYRHLTFRLPSYWKMEKISMSCRTSATIAAFIVFALVSVARAQAPVQTSTQATALPPDDDFYSLREPAAAGNAQPQFALGSHYFYGVGFPHDYRQPLLWHN